MPNTGTGFVVLSHHSLKSGSPSNMWISLVTVDRVSSEIRMQKQKKEKM